MSYPKSPHQQIRSIKTGLLAHIRLACREFGLEAKIHKASPLLRELSIKRLQALAKSVDSSDRTHATMMIDEVLRELAE